MLRNKLVALVCLFYVSAEIIQVVVLSRHCDRTPLTGKLPHDPVDWEQTLELEEGQLTPLGMQQCHKMGTILRERYLEPSSYYRIKDVSTKYTASKFHFIATDTERTIISLWSASMGLFPPGSTSAPNIRGRHALPAGVTPIPIHTNELLNDITFRGHDLCPTITKRLAEKYASADYEILKSQHGNAIEKLMNDTGLNGVTLESFYDTFDLINVQRNHGLLKLDQVEKFFHVYSDINNVAHREKFNFRTMGKLGGGMFIKRIIEFMKQGYKYVHISAHDSTIGALAAALRLTDDYEIFKIQPAYGSNLIFELHEENGLKFIRIVYRNGYDDDTFTIYRLTTLGCTKDCMFERFETLCKEYVIPTNWCRECGNVVADQCLKDLHSSNEISLSNVTSIIPLIACVNLLAVGALLLSYWKTSSKKLEDKTP